MDKNYKNIFAKVVLRILLNDCFSLSCHIFHVVLYQCMYIFFIYSLIYSKINFETLSITYCTYHNNKYFVFIVNTLTGRKRFYVNFDFSHISRHEIYLFWEKSVL